jgi:sugar lactone lactonase YvrE
MKACNREFMKTSLRNLYILPALLASLAQTTHAAVTFSITPATVSNTYSGYITLQIDGLTNTETVVIQKFLDLNTNGVVDGRDLMVQQFSLKDGQAGMVIDGVNNFNVPGDLDPTPGAITASLSFQNGDFMQNIIGRYFFKLSSPAGHFTPLTNGFSITNFPFPQGIAGNVVSNNTSTTVPNAVVIMFQPPSAGNSGPGNPLGGVVANNAGSYAVQMPPGTYVPMVLSSNYAYNYFTAAPKLTLAAGQTITANLTLTNATSSISGRVVDANNNGIGLPVCLYAQNTNGLIAFTCADTNGNFNIPVTAGLWGLGTSYPFLIIHGYVGWYHDPNYIASAGATVVNMAYPKATALFYGSVKDNLGNPLPGIAIGASDNNELYDMEGYTDINGNYVIGALGGLSSDPWQVSVESLPNYVFSYSSFGNTNLGTGQAVLANFTGTLLPLQVTTVALPNCTNGMAYNQQLSAINGQLPYSWLLISGSLPSGLVLATNGMISGTPTTNGTFNCAVQVTDALFATATQALTLTVGSPPSIVVMQPTNGWVTVPVGSNVAFSVSVAGTGPFSYQWQLNGTNLPNGIITTVAGNGYGAPGYSGDGGAATNAQLYEPFGVAVDATGNLFIADTINWRIRKVGSDGIITTVAGNGTNGYSGDGNTATNAELSYPEGVAVDASGNLFFADGGRIRKVDTSGIITTVAGNGTNGYSGDGNTATNAELNGPQGVAVDATGNLFIADLGNNRIRKVGTNGIITTVVGNGIFGYSGDGGAATNAELTNPWYGVAVDASGDLFFVDYQNDVIRKVGPNGIISTVAGNWRYGNGYSGDGGAATNAQLYDPFGVAVDASGNLFIADLGNNRIRKVGSNAIITTVAGNGYTTGSSRYGGFSGDGGAATNAELNWPSDVAVDAIGSLFIVDTLNNVIRKVIFPGPTLVLNDVGFRNAGTYDVVVTSPYGSATSSVVNLTVGVILSAPRVTGGKTNFTFVLSGPAGSNYVLQVSTNLSYWSPVSTSTIPVSGSTTLSNAISGYNRRFYRAYLQ